MGASHDLDHCGGGHALHPGIPQPGFNPRGSLSGLRGGRPKHSETHRGPDHDPDRRSCFAPRGGSFPAGVRVGVNTGFPIRFYVFSTQIYWLLNQQPPQFSAATALASVILFVTIPLIVLQRRTVARRDYATIGGRYQGHKQSLGKWRWPILFCLLTVALLITLVPLSFLTLASFMARFGYFHVPRPWTSVHWGRVFCDPVFVESVKNTLVLAGATAILSIVVFTFVAYVVIRTRFVGRAALDFASWLPSS